LTYRIVRRKVTLGEDRMVRAYINEKQRHVARHLIEWRRANGLDRTIVNQYETEREYGDVRVICEHAEDIREPQMPRTRITVIVEYVDREVGRLLICISNGRVTSMDPAKVESVSRWRFFRRVA